MKTKQPKKAELTEAINEAEARVYLAERARIRFFAHLDGSKFATDPMINRDEVKSWLMQGMRDAMFRQFSQAFNAKIIFPTSGQCIGIPFVELRATVKATRLTFMCVGNGTHAPYDVEIGIPFSNLDWPLDGTHNLPYVEAQTDVWATVQTVRMTLETAIEHGLI